MGSGDTLSGIQDKLWHFLSCLERPNPKTIWILTPIFFSDSFWSHFLLIYILKAVLVAVPVVLFAPSEPFPFLSQPARCHAGLQECSASMGRLACWLLVGSKKCVAEKEKEESETLDCREQQHVLGWRVWI